MPCFQDHTAGEGWGVDSTAGSLQWPDFTAAVTWPLHSKQALPSQPLRMGFFLANTHKQRQFKKSSCVCARLPQSPSPPSALTCSGLFHPRTRTPSPSTQLFLTPAFSPLARTLHAPAIPPKSRPVCLPRATAWRFCFRTSLVSPLRMWEEEDFF